jgi:hypothetical protein
MIASRVSRTARFASAAVASVLVLSSASYANSYEQLFPGKGYSAPRSDTRAYYSGGGSYSSYPGSTPRDFVSSHVCINGYRWITRDLDRGWESPAQNAIPVRC